MELKFIGTGSGKTSLKRYHSSFLIKSDNFNLLVDSGDGISRALLKQKVHFNLINGILISHLHPDHYAGLPSLIVQMKMNERSNPLYIFCNESYSYFLKEFIHQSYLFRDNLGFKINFKSFINDKKCKVLKSLNFIARQNSHLQKKVRADKSRRLSFSCCSFLIKINDKNIFFTGDIGQKKDLFLFKDEKINLMISEITHISVEELIEAFRKLKPEKLFITHISDEDEAKVKQLSDLLHKAERKNVVAAFDGLSVKIF